MLQGPVPPMLAKLANSLPEGEGWIFEPKWDGFRAIVFRDGDDLLLQSRDLKPLNRYFPELEDPLRRQLPRRCVVDGEIVIAGPDGLDFDALLLRIHPAASRIKLLASQTPASYVAFDLLALGDEDLREAPQEERRRHLEDVLASVQPPLYLTPATRDRAVAQDWFSRFEGAGFDGVVAKRADQPYQPDKRTMLKIKHQRTADCVVAGFRWHKNGPGTMIGSLLLGLYDREGKLHHVGVTSSFTAASRKALVNELAPLREGAAEGHPGPGSALCSADACSQGAPPDRGTRDPHLESGEGLLPAARIHEARSGPLLPGGRHGRVAWGGGQADGAEAVRERRGGRVLLPEAGP